MRESSVTRGSALYRKYQDCRQGLFPRDEAHRLRSSYRRISIKARELPMFTIALMMVMTKKIYIYIYIERYSDTLNILSLRYKQAAALLMVIQERGKGSNFDAKKGKECDTIYIYMYTSK